MYYSYKDIHVINLDVSINILQYLHDFFLSYLPYFKALDYYFKVCTLCKSTGALLAIVRSRKKKFVNWTSPIPVSKLFVLEESYLLNSKRLLFRVYFIVIFIYNGNGFLYHYGKARGSYTILKNTENIIYFCNTCLRNEVVCYGQSHWLF